MPSSSRLAVIALDAADSRLLCTWAQEGYLPTFARLFERGAVASIATPPAVLEGAIWPTLTTSLSPATHGMFSSMQIIPGTYRWRAGVTAARLPVPPFWSHLSDAGKRVAAIDVPFTKPVKNLNGIQVTNWGAHDAWSYKRSSWPTDLLSDLVSRFGDHPIPSCDVVRQGSLREYEHLRSQLITGVQKKTAMLRHYLCREPWDFFFAVYSESHCVGHQCWHLADPGHPRYIPTAPSTLRSVVRDVYQAIDKGLGRLLEHMPTDAEVVVLSTHGMGPWYAGSHLIPSVLDRLGMTGPVPAIKDAVWAARKVLSTTGRSWLKNGWMKDAINRCWEWSHRNPVSRMRAFHVPSNNMTGAVRINLKGREPAGLVAPGREYDALCKELADAFLALENPETGRKAVQWVARASDLYQGASLEEFPDLFIEWDHSAPINALRSPAIGTVTGSLEVERSGDHYPGGLLIASGPSFTSGRIDERIRTMDLAPTILQFFGVPIPATFQGRSVLNALCPAQPSSHAVSYSNGHARMETASLATHVHP